VSGQSHGKGRGGAETEQEAVRGGTGKEQAFPLSVCCVPSERHMKFNLR
jgi:hypothetical protein